MKITEIDPSQLSSAIYQYYQIKIKHLDKIVFFQMGDFYEMFFEDAIYMNQVCNLMLTSKACGLSEKIPMAGIPIHQAEEYIKQVVKDHHKVVLVDQSGLSNDQKIMKRHISKIISASNYLDDLDAHKYIGCGAFVNKQYLYAYGDINTGDLYYFTTNNYQYLLNEVNNNKTVEIININNCFKPQDIANTIFINNKCIDHLININTIQQILLDYIKTLDHYDLCYLKPFQEITLQNYLRLNKGSLQALDLFTNETDQQDISLFSFLNHTKTVLGKRLLKEFMLHPLINIDEILIRQQYINVFYEDQFLLANIQASLKNIYDLNRLIIRINDYKINPKEIIQLKISCMNAMQVVAIIKNHPILKTLLDNLEPLDDLITYLDEMIDNDPNAFIKEGKVINDNVNQELDELRNIKTNQAAFINNYEQQLRQSLNCKNLKIKYNRVLNYFIEVPKGSINDEIKNLQEIQNLVNVIRYTTSELQNMADKITHASERIYELESEIYESVKRKLISWILVLTQYSSFIALIDTYQSLGYCANYYGLVKPCFNTNNIIDIKDAYHPVIKNIIPEFIYNDLYLDKDHKIMLITGPNMSGKSTYMRQIALLIIMAQMGSFVPCKNANLCIIDQIFTRIGAQDNTSKGQSTFMVEMDECSVALHNATNNSLLLFDELGRGTSTYDGISLASSIIDAIAKRGCFMLFATHYHELISLEQHQPTLFNMHVGAKCDDSQITFLHKLQPGGSQYSYGIEVASLANLPQSVISNAKKYLNYFLDKQPQVIIKQATNDYQPIIDQLKNLDVNNLTPLQALSFLHELKQFIKEEDDH